MSEDEVSRAIDHVMSEIGGGLGLSDPSSMDNEVWFRIGEESAASKVYSPSSNLRVAVNRNSGYGALTWFADRGYMRRGGVWDTVWISDGKEPLEFDPWIVSDCGYPLFHDPASAISIPTVWSAVREFCQSASGDRPACVDWVAGEVNGQRNDRPPIGQRHASPSTVDISTDIDIDWDLLK